MEFHNVISPEKAVGLEGAGVGAVIRLMIYGRLDWRIAIGVASCAMACSYYFTIPLTRIVSADPQMDGPGGFVIGLLALQVCTGIVNLGMKFAERPMSFLRFLPWFKNGTGDKDGD